MSGPSTSNASLKTVALAVLLAMPWLMLYVAGPSRAPGEPQLRRKRFYLDFHDRATAGAATLDSGFGLRRQLISATGLLHVAVNVSPNQTVTIGKNGWWYLANDGEEGCIPRRKLGEKEVLGWVAKILNARDQSLASGARFYFLLAPCKHTIYPEHYPEAIASDSPDLDEILRRLASAGVRVIDPRRTLIESKGLGLYFHRDSHWNPDGARIACDLLAKAVQNDFPKERRGPALGLTPYKARIKGDLVRAAGLGDWFSEDFQDYRSAEASIEAFGTAKYVLDGLIRTRRSNPGGLRAIVVRDSFGAAMAPFFAAEYQSAEIYRRFDLPDEALSKGKPDVVVFELAERAFSRTSGPNAPPD